MKIQTFKGARVNLGLTRVLITLVLWPTMNDGLTRSALLVENFNISRGLSVVAIYNISCRTSETRGETKEAAVKFPKKRKRERRRTGCSALVVGTFNMSRASQVSWYLFSLTSETRGETKEAAVKPQQ